MKIMKIMKKFYKKIFYLLMVLTALSACQSLKDGLTGKKKNNTDEFLVEKKNPLVLPPKFDELPKPKILTEENKNKNEKEIDLKSIIITESSVETKIPIDKTIGSSLENKILEKIKKN